MNDIAWQHNIGNFTRASFSQVGQNSSRWNDWLDFSWIQFIVNVGIFKLFENNLANVWASLCFTGTDMIAFL
jgi:hypothetical protein